MSDRAVITLDELIEEVKPPTLADKAEHVAAYVEELQALTEIMTGTLRAIAEGINEMARVWNTRRAY